MIRKARESDLPAIDRLGALFAREIQGNSPLNDLADETDPGAAGSRYATYFAEDAKVFVAEREGEVVAFVSGRILQRTGMKIARYGKIDDLYVAERYRGAGLASRLVDALLAWLRGNGCTYVVLFAAPGQPIRQYYERIGFRTLYYYTGRPL